MTRERRWFVVALFAAGALGWAGSAHEARPASAEATRPGTAGGGDVPKYVVPQWTGDQPTFAKLLAVGDEPALRATGEPLTEAEKKMARTAWRYFERNTQAATGLINSVDQFPSTTMWDLGSGLMGLLAAEELGLVTNGDATRRLGTLLASLEKLPLVGLGLPNKSYDTRTLRAVDYNGKEVAEGIGWSTTDIARIAVPFDVLAWRHPEQVPRLRSILSKWKLSAVVGEGEMRGGLAPEGGQTRIVQEGRFGYEQYCAKSLFLLGLDVSRAMSYRAHVAIAPVSGQSVAFDSRFPREHGGVRNSVLSEPYLLEGLEFGLDQDTLPIARAIYIAQRNRAKETGRPTAVSEDNLDREPWFVYNTVISDMKPWDIYAHDLKPAPGDRTLSTKAAIGWAYLFSGPYSDELLAAIQGANDPARGWMAGRYEADDKWNASLTANTNGIILEALAYKTRGPWLRWSRRP